MINDGWLQLPQLTRHLGSQAGFTTPKSGEDVWLAFFTPVLELWYSGSHYSESVLLARISAVTTSTILPFPKEKSLFIAFKRLEK